jgi:hypothetical protein
MEIEMNTASKTTCLIATAVLAGPVLAAPFVSYEKVEGPAAGVSTYLFTADSGSDDVNISVFTFEATGPIHQVWRNPGAGPGETPDPDHATGIFWDEEWDAFDSRFLFGSDDLLSALALSEENDASNPYGLDFEAFTNFPAVVGLGSISGEGLGLKPALAAPTVTFLQLIVPDGEAFAVSGAVAGGGQRAEFGFVIPEPASMALLALGFAPLMRRQSR